MPYTPPLSATHMTQLLTSEYEGMLAWIQLQEGIIEDLEIEIERLKNPTVPNPTGRIPIITRSVLKNIAGITIENGNTEPDDAQYELVRTAIRQAAEMGFNAARWFMNQSEVKEHLAVTGIGHLPTFAYSEGIAYIADTVDSVVWQTFKIEDDPLKSATQKAIATANLTAYLKGLETLRAKAFFINDANTYRDGKKADGTPLFPKGTLERIITRIRSICPTMPLIASLTGNAVIADYKIMPTDSIPVTMGKCDFVEAQTFGKLAELSGFLSKAFDVFCFDGRKGIVTEAYLKGAKPLILARNPSCYFWYPTLASDWQAESMKEEIGVIKEIVQAWRKM